MKNPLPAAERAFHSLGNRTRNAVAVLVVVAVGGFFMRGYIMDRVTGADAMKAEIAILKSDVRSLTEKLQACYKNAQAKEDLMNTKLDGMSRDITELRRTLERR